MIELANDHLRFSFPEVHEEAQFAIDFQRTLRIPDDGSDYPLPPGLGSFPLRDVDDFAATVPDRWLRHGGILFPMYQSEAMWLNFRAPGTFPYPFAVKVAAGKINAVTGESWENGLHEEPQDYVVLPSQPWLDGYCVEEGLIRQFVAMPLGAGYSAEEQLTGEAEHGGLQVIAYPMKREAYLERREEWEERVSGAYPRAVAFQEVACRLSARSASPDMGLAPGGRMRQKIHEDPYRFDEWETEAASRCFVHIANSMVWRSITGSAPPTTPPTAKAYTEAGLPWFEVYSDGPAVKGSSVLEGLRSVLQIGKEKGDVPLPENESVTPDRIVRLRRGLRPGQVREGSF